MASAQNTAVTPRQESFRRILGLEKMQKMNRLQNFQQQQASELRPPPVSLHNRALLQTLCPTFLDQYQRHDCHSQSERGGGAMLDLEKKTIVHPTLSMTISGMSGEQAAFGIGGRNQSDNENKPNTNIASQSPPKQVNYKDVNGSNTDRSSICQSPGWEDDGNKRKERKKKKKAEAERKKREKQHKLDAREAKKRLGSRLGKAPSPSILDSASPSPAFVLGNNEIYMSDALLAGPDYYHPDRITLASDLQNTPQRHDLPWAASFRPSTPDSGLEPPRSFWSRPSSRQGQYGSVLPESRQLLASPQPKTMTSTNGLQLWAPPPKSSVLVESASNAHIRPGRGSGTSHPPSASRTPLLRQQPASPMFRDNTFLSGATKMFKTRNQSHELARGDWSDRGRQQDGYVQHCRTQSTQRVMSGFVDEESTAAPLSRDLSLRGSSQQPEHKRRRSSFTQEAKSLAMRLVGIKPAPEKNPPAQQTGLKRAGSSDYPGLATQVHSPPVLALISPMEKTLGFTENSDCFQTSLDASRQQTTRAEPDNDDKTPTNVTGPANPYDDLSASTFFEEVIVHSTADSGNKGRSSENASKAAINTNTVPTNAPPRNTTKPAGLDPPYDKLCFRLNSISSGSLSRQNFLGQEKASPTQQRTALQQGTESTVSEAPLNPDLWPLTPLATNPISSQYTALGEADSNRARDEVSGISTSSFIHGTNPTDPCPTEARIPSGPQSTTARSQAVEMAVSPHQSGLYQKDEEGSKKGGFKEPDDAKTAMDAEIVDDDFKKTVLCLDGDFDAQSFVTSLSHPDEDHSKQLAQESTMASSSDLRGALTDTTQASFVSALGEEIQIPAKSRKRELSCYIRQDPPSHEAFPKDLGLDMQKKSREKTAGQVGQDQKSRPGELATQQSPQMSGTPPKLQSRSGVTNLKTHTARGFSLESEATTEGSSVTQESMKDSITSDSARSSNSSLLSARCMSPVAGFVPAVGLSSNAKAMDMKEAGDQFMNLKVAGFSQLKNIEASRESLGPAKEMLASCPFLPPSPRPSLGTRSARVKSIRLLRETTPSSAAPQSSKSQMSGATTSSPPIPARNRPRPQSTFPASILKRPTRPTSPPSMPTPSAAKPSASLKHMHPMSPPQSALNRSPADLSRTPVAKVFVSCCDCGVLHDLPAKMYECMAQPDAVVEDRSRGVSGAITMAVRCPWCQHEMKTSCCAGYAAVVFFKEKLH